ncbi:MAG TPA: preprotein translocase subunit SecA [Bacteroidia bacterium]|jgi:preprotein translocase subunit SecA|nr:preprotein translocase subunit SecA [Bacteroidia bacterium]
MFEFLSKMFGTKSQKDVESVQPLVDKIKQVFPSLESLSNDALREKSAGLQKQIQDYTGAEKKQIADIKARIENEADMDVDSKDRLYKEIDEIEKGIDTKTEEVLLEILPEAFALCKETARRFSINEEIKIKASDIDTNYLKRNPGAKNVEIRDGYAYWKNSWTAAGGDVKWNMVHYDVQLIGGIVLHQGKISEMATGEGKTLVATLPIFLNALSNKGVHVVTVNNYLSRRDAEWNGPIFEFHGLTVDCIDKHEPHSQERRDAYNCHITYGTNNEFGFDYLRDNMSHNIEGLVQRKHNFAIVDEVDSVLIDDARTPLIISGPTPQGDKHEFVALKPRVDKLVNAQKQYLQTCLTDAKKLFAEGKEKEAGIPLLRAFRGLPKNTALIKFLSENGVRALLQKTENYYMQDQQKEMHKIDAELYFVIDEKNNSVDMTEKGIDLITSSGEDAGFFIIPNVGDQIAEIEKMAVAGDEKMRRKEILLQEFSVKSERIHTIVQLLKAYALFDKDDEYVVMDGQIKIVDEQTGRIMEGRRYSDGLHQAIEAKENVKIEAATQTYATITLQNYFRMYHKLAGMTGTAETESQEFWDIYKLDVVVIPTNRPISRKDEQDYVYKTKREKYNAVIEEIAKLVAAGRPVLVGTTTVENSEILSRMLKLRGIKHNVLNAKQHQKEAQIVAEAGWAGNVTIATNMAGRGTDIKLGQGVKESGGLAIIGTERHESRRVDRQLRGRAGRQGDPGTSQFFVSLEDDLMRLFGSERIARLMDRMGLQEGEVIQHSMITKSIERAQKKVEENNFGIRKRLIEYDDVMNVQRDVIYKRRRNALFGDKLSVDIANVMYDVGEEITSIAHDDRDYEGLKFELLKTFSIDAPFTQEEFNAKNTNDLTNAVFAESYKHYKEKNELVSGMVFPVVKDVYQNPNNQFENIVTPFTDGIRNMQVMANLKKCYDTQGRAMVLEFEKIVTLAMIDDSWKEHLRELDDLKQSVQNASLEQKDPLLIYKLESFNLFKEMVTKTNKEVITFLVKGSLPQQNNAEQIPQVKFGATAQQQQKKEQLVESRNDSIGGVNEDGERVKIKQQPVRVEQKVGRNDPCPCGSGKKFKNCHGQGG